MRTRQNEDRLDWITLSAEAIDHLSAEILRPTALILLHQYPTLTLRGIASTYEQALAQLPPPK